MSRTNLGSERGAVLIQTAIAATVMVGFGAFVADYGVLWVARHQAQNAADAGAMAGAIARAYDDFDNANPADSNGVTAQNALALAGANPVWGAPPAPVASFTCPADIVAVDPNRRCVSVDAHRDGLPTWFGPLLGVTSQGVKATATAQVMIGNATNCLRPWAIPDNWAEGTGDSSFRRYDLGGIPIPPPHDDYTPPSATIAGTGRTFATSNAAPGDLGRLIALTAMPLVEVTNPLTPSPDGAIPNGSLVALALDGLYEDNVAACNGQVLPIGTQITISPSTPTNVDFEGRVLADIGATWNPATNTIDGSCAPSCAPISPRLVAIALYDVDLFQLHHATNDWSSCPLPGVPCVSIVNIVGFFIDDSSPRGFLTSYPGLTPTDAPKLSAASSFLKAITLVR